MGLWDLKEPIVSCFSKTFPNRRKEKQPNSAPKMASRKSKSTLEDKKEEEKRVKKDEEVIKMGKKKDLGWIEWFRGWFYVVYEFLFQRIMATHLENPLPLPPLNHLTCIVTGSTSGIGLEITRQLAESGAHVVMAVRNVEAAHELVRKWQDKGLPLDIEVMPLDLLSLDSVVTFADAWNSRSGPLHVLINNAGIFSIGDLIVSQDLLNPCCHENCEIFSYLLSIALVLYFSEPQKFSSDGYEAHMQVNHLAPALLSLLLFPSLIRGSPSRIVNVNSIVSCLI
ncbi:dehydrogenase [Lithospermum erythrorhizon]|uniref:Dehydrogenase n=1 Tax=Lithospermum erythrorhizon TaxID=34254 RepID=A0AAV3NTI1_LITER